MIQNWSDAPLSPEKFKEEVSMFSQIADAELPKSTLWLHENFKLKVPPMLYDWLETEVTKRHFMKGMHKVVYTVSPEFKSHLSVVNSFIQTKSVVSPAFYTDQTEAKSFISSEEIVGKTAKNPDDFKLELERSDESVKLQVEIDINDLPKVIGAINAIKASRKLVLSKMNDFLTLTRRECEVMRYLALGYSNNQIAMELYISINTVKNHRKRIISKLNISSQVQFYEYARAFNLIHFA